MSARSLLAGPRGLLFSVAVVCLGPSGCLIKNDYDLEGQRPRGEQSAAPPVVLPPECDEGAVSCVGRRLLQCMSGRWELQQQCPAESTCSGSLGRCASCEPGLDHICTEGRLERCRHDGTGYELVEDCVAAGKLCDVELSFDRCLDCRAAEQRCGETTLQRCVDGRFVDAGACELGSCQVVDGRTDHCPECTRQMQQACGLGSRVVCTESLELEELELCPEGCSFDAGVTRCR